MYSYVLYLFPIILYYKYSIYVLIQKTNNCLSIYFIKYYYIYLYFLQPLDKKLKNQYTFVFRVDKHF